MVWRQLFTDAKNVPTLLEAGRGREPVKRRGLCPRLRRITLFVSFLKICPLPRFPPVPISLTCAPIPAPWISPLVVLPKVGLSSLRYQFKRVYVHLTPQIRI